MFDDYYLKYIGSDDRTLINGCMVYKAEDRDIPLNNRFIYRIIITDFRGIRTISVSPNISDNLIYDICNDIKDKAFEDILQSGPLHRTGLRINKMYRMRIDNAKFIENTTKDINIKMECINENRKFVIRDGDKMVSYCKISNIDYNCGNIVVWTDEDYRRKGFARELLYRTIHKCKVEGIEPIYLVDSQNIASIKLAQSVGFKIMQDEIVGCEVLS